MAPSASRCGLCSRASCTSATESGGTACTSSRPWAAPASRAARALNRVARTNLLGVAPSAADEIGQRRPQARERLEGPEVQDLVEQEGRGRAVGRAGAAQEREARVEGLARSFHVCGRQVGGTPERRGRREDPEEALGRCRNPFDIDVLAGAGREEVQHGLQHRRPPGGAPAREHRDGPRGFRHRARQARRDCAGHRVHTAERGTIGSRRPSRAAVRNASG